MSKRRQPASFPSEAGATWRDWIAVHRRDGLILAGLLVLALALRLAGITREHAWNDEVLVLMHLDADTLRAFIAGVRRDEITASLGYPLLAWASVTLMPIDHLALLRAVSIVLGLLSLGGVYYLGRRLGGGYTAVTAVLLLAVSQIHIYYSQETRPYALLMAAITLSSIAFLNAYNKPRPPTGWLAVNVCANAVIVWTHMLGGLLLVVQGLTLLLFRGRRYTQWLTWGLLQLPAVVLMAALWIRTLDWKMVGVVTEYLPKPGLEEIMRYLYMAMGTRPPRYSPMSHPVHTIPPLEAGIVLLGGIGLLACVWYLFRSSRNQGQTSESLWERRLLATYLLFWFVIPATLLFVLSHVWTPVFLPRYLTHATLPLGLLVAFGFSMFPRNWMRTGLAALMILVTSYVYFAFSEPIRPNYGAALAHILDRGGQGEPVAVYPRYQERMVQYNWDRLYEPSGFTTPEWLDSWDDLRDRLEAKPSEQARAWLIHDRINPHGLTNEQVELRLSREGMQFERKAIPAGLYWLFVYELTLTEPDE